MLNKIIFLSDLYLSIMKFVTYLQEKSILQKIVNECNLSVDLEMFSLWPYENKSTFRSLTQVDA